MALHQSYKCNCNNPTQNTLHHSYNSSALQLQPQLHYATLHPALALRCPLQPLQPSKNHNSNQLSVDQWINMWFTTTNLSHGFPIFETSATALCSTTDLNRIYHQAKSGVVDFVLVQSSIKEETRGYGEVVEAQTGPFLIHCGCLDPIGWGYSLRLWQSSNAVRHCGAGCYSDLERCDVDRAWDLTV